MSHQFPANSGDDQDERMTEPCPPQQHDPPRSLWKEIWPHVISGLMLSAILAVLNPIILPCWQWAVAAIERICVSITTR